MADNYESAVTEAKSRNGVSGLVERLTQQMAPNATTHTVFGEPIERDGVTVIPVAKVRWGVGGGSGVGANQNTHREGEGEGGGGGMMATPVGYIEIAGGQAQFRRIVDPAAMWPVLLVGGIAGWLVLRAFRSIFR